MTLLTLMEAFAAERGVVFRDLEIGDRDGPLPRTQAASDLVSSFGGK